MIAAEPFDPGGTALNGFFAGSAAPFSIDLPSGRAPKPEPPNSSDSRSIPSSGKSVASDTMMPLPIAVCRCSSKRSIAAIRSSRLCVGGCTTEAVPAKDTMPTSTSAGCSCTNALAAVCAASSRLGLMSFARMLSETSIANMVVRWSDGSVTTALGRAIAKIVASSAIRKSKGGTWRRKRCRRPIASRTRPTLA